uniref:NADH-ubiquinone oxidoreductase chain 6 n=1 Tax=Heleodromia immaculata TaxID=1403662 RepID=A0A161FHA9_9MUSC|nr:NADH dehydrogenase subunit 6 [Heleodromia immaculata]
MLQNLLYMMSLIMSFIFLQMNHPLAMGMMLLIQTTLICLITGLLTKTFWFAYILFLIFIGGMLVLFIYVASLASNEMFSMSIKLMISMMILILMFLIIIYMCDKTILFSFFSNNEMTTIYNLNSFMPENSINLIKMYNYPTNLITLLLMNYLLITLIAVVKITNMNFGPLRLMN